MFHADLHIHSRFSRACSKDCDIPHLAAGALRKGLSVIGTGDFTHPAWADELKANLVPAEDGLLRLRPDLEREVRRRVPAACAQPVRFMLSVEISTIYRRGERTRKVHHLIYAPTLDAAGRITVALSKIGNLASDGRPILGLDSRDLLEITLEGGPGCYLVPAHIWTPWFAVLGSKSGFDAVADCYGDLAGEIFAVETGLSSDPAMNWMCSSLDAYRLVSNSDAHSPPMLGREATTFTSAMDYFSMADALRTGDGLAGTIEFYPEEGKYHLDGHRKCGVRFDPWETRERDGTCPECHKPLTVGVLHRVAELADRPNGYRPAGAAGFNNLVQLPQIIGEILSVGPRSKAVNAVIDRLVADFGPELTILQQTPVDDLARIGGSPLGEAISRLRRGEVTREAGYDGEYGVVRLFQPAELDRADALFDLPTSPAPGTPAEKGKKQRKEDQNNALKQARAGAPPRGTDDPQTPSGTPGAASAVPPGAAPGGGELGGARSGSVGLRGAEASHAEASGAKLGRTEAGSAEAGAAGARAAGTAGAGAAGAGPRDAVPIRGTTPAPGSAGRDGPAPHVLRAHEPSPGTLSPDGLSPDGLSPDGLSPDGLSPDGLSPDGLSPDGLGSGPLGGPGVPRPRQGESVPGETAGSLLDGLDDEQRAAAVADGPLMIVAGPGTGKTRTLTHRIAFQIAERNIPAERFLAITFTRRAAEEMRQRLAALLGPNGSPPAESTPNGGTPGGRTAIDAPHGGSTPGGSTPTDTTPGDDLSREGTPDWNTTNRSTPASKNMPNDRTSASGAPNGAAPGEGRSRVTVTTFHGLALRLLSEHPDLAGLPPEFRVADDAARLEAATRVTGSERDGRRLLSALGGAPGDRDARPAEHEALRADLAQHGLVDLDDLIGLAVRLLRDQPAVAAAARERWPRISVDEYQDIDEQQYELLRLLAGEDAAGLTVIGDPDQAIYGFRGADVGFFLRFGTDYPDARRVHLTRNYRCSPAIVTAALQAIAPATLVPGRELRAMAHGPAATGPASIAFHQAAGEEAEGAWIAEQIDRLIGGSSFHSLDSGRVDARDRHAALGLSDIAVLYRTDAQAGSLAQALTRAGLPFQKRSHDRLARRPGVRDLVREMRLADPAAPDGPGALGGGSERLDKRDGSEEGGGVTHALWNAAGRLTALTPPTAPAAVDVLTARDVLAPLAARCGDDLERFFTEITLGAEADALDPRADAVTLLTLHAAKGLEFDVVFIAGCERGLLPLWLPGATSASPASSSPASGSPASGSPASSPEGQGTRVDTSEERRLLFVGMTRARVRLFLTCAARRTRLGGSSPTGPSPFLAAIEPGLLKHATPARRPTPDRQLRLL